MKRTFIYYPTLILMNFCFLFMTFTINGQTTPEEEPMEEMEMDDEPIFEDMDIEEDEVIAPLVKKGTMTSEDRVAQKEVFEHFEHIFDRSRDFQGKYSEIWRVLAPYKYEHTRVNRVVYVVQPHRDSKEGYDALRQGFDKKDRELPRASFWIEFDENDKAKLEIMLSPGTKSN